MMNQDNTQFLQRAIEYMLDAYLDSNRITRRQAAMVLQNLVTRQTERGNRFLKIYHQIGEVIPAAESESNETRKKKSHVTL
jgi:hypothetical protein